MKITRFTAAARVVLLGAVATAAFAQQGPPPQPPSADYAVFQGVMASSKEVPANNSGANGYATIRAHAVRDNSGVIVSGSVQFLVDYNLPANNTITGLHIHSGGATVSGPVVINTGLGGANTIVTTSPSGRVDLTAEVTPDNAAGVAALAGLFADPSQYYVNIHTTDFPGGIMRTQLKRASLLTVGGMMSSANEVPANPSGATGLSIVTTAVTRDNTGTIENAMVTFDLKYTLNNPETFVGYHIHSGVTGVNGPVRISTGLTGTNSIASDPSGTGTLHFDILAVATDPGVRDTLENMFNSPGQAYINIHTLTYSGGIMRDQLRAMDSIVIPANMQPQNEVPAVTGLNANAQGLLTVNTIRGNDGSVIAGGVNFDVNYRFPANTTFTGLHIHNGDSTVSGPVTINTGLGGANTIPSATGSGNITRQVVVMDAAGLATLNSITTTPDQQYVNLHTTANPGGAVRAQLAGPLRPAQVTGIISAVSDPTLTTLPQGGLISIYGNSLSRLTDTLSAFSGNRLPASYDGVKVTIGGATAPLLFLSPNLLNVQVPFEAPLGNQPVVVSVGGNPGPPFQATVTAAAPGIFFDGVGGIVVKNSDFSLIRPENPAVRGKDVLVIYCTGLGATNPVTPTGAFVNYPPLASVPGVAATLGGQALTVYYAAASPGFVGLYQVATNVPASLAAGTQTLTITAGGVTSNAVKIAVQ